MKLGHVFGIAVSARPRRERRCCDEHAEQKKKCASAVFHEN